MEVESENQNFWHGYFYTINSIIGSGMLAIPWAYSEGGWLLGVLSQIFTTTFTLILSYHQIQIMSRIEVLCNLSKRGYRIIPVKPSQFLARTFPEDFIVSDKGYKEEEELLEIKDKPVISQVRFDLCEMISVLLGKSGAVLFGISLSLSIYGALVAYCSIFASSLASTIPIFGLNTCNIYDDSIEFADDCWKIYWFYLFIFLVSMSLLVIIGLKEQAGFQSVMSIMRFLVIFLILGTSIEAISSDTNLTDSNSNNGSLDLINPMSIGITLPIIYLATSFHSTIPCTLQYVRNKNINVPRIINSSLFTITILYTLIGIFVPLSKSNPESMMTINWIDYTGGHSDQSWWSMTIMYIIILFPALDIFSLFPILAIALSDNLMALQYGKFNENSISKETFFFYRFLVIIPPVMVAMLFYSLGYILDFTGTLSIFVAGVFVPLMSIASRKMVTQHGDYDYWFVNEKWSWFILISSLVFFIITWTFLLIWII
ncbi:hypothetical protein SteCoe_26734 [Stentor coeruleus]|uniref:Amino acid transporter transmembrane domain-containing protein n=1 Tax=Stentor coeruleus TaxID=5963 RepID=A0A1R2BCJ2_9CILI|nr:hypothetical protein SteCoe_26734 [Stentor coeruleus]